MKISADRDGTQRFFSAKLGWREKFDSREIEMLLAGAVPRLIPPVVVQGRKNNVLRFDISAYSTMEFQLSCVLSRERFADILLQCIEIFRQMHRVYLSYKNLIFDLDKVYVRMEDWSIHFIYLPLMDSKRDAEIPDFFKRILQKTGRSTYEQASFLDACLAWLERPIPFSLEGFDAFVRESVGEEAEMMAKASPVDHGAMLRSDRIYQPSFEEKKDILGGVHVHGSTCPLNLASDGGTVLLGALGSSLPTSRFFLLSARSGEKIEITHTPFLVGTETGSVSYRVTENGAVSRRHAEFTIQDGRCFIIDQNSTNKTYINNCALLPLTPHILESGDQIRLGNEGFTFLQEE